MSLEVRQKETSLTSLLGVANYKLNSFDNAKASLLRALDLDAHLGQARLALANVYIRIQKWADALSQLDMYLQENPKASDRAEICAIRSKIETMMGQAAGG